MCQVGSNFECRAIYKEDINDMNIEVLKRYLATGTVPAEDESPASVDLKTHDLRFHGGHYDGKGACKYRESLAKGDDADSLARAERSERSDRSRKDEAASPQDYQDLEDIRSKLEAAARLLNGRAGNAQALQASRRWGLLNSLPDDQQVQSDLTRLKGSSDPAIAQMAGDLDKILNAIRGSKAGGWNQGVGMVPASISGHGAQGPQTSSAPIVPTASHQTKGFTDDDAKAILGRLAKSINHHINKGDFTPNANAVAKYQAHKKDIAALKDPQLDKFCQEIDASLAAGNQKNISMVPPPSAAWQQAHQPQMPAGGLGAIFAALLGGGAGQQQPIKGKFSGQTWTPFSSPSGWAKAISQANANHPAATDPDYFKNQADAMTVQQAIADMENSGSIVKGGFRDSIDPNDPDELALWGGPHNPLNGWWNPSKRLSADTARCAAVCFADLRKRFPNMPWKDNLEFRCGEHTGSTGGQSVHTADDRRHSVLFGCDYKNIWAGTGLGKRNYGHPDARFPFDVLRHEMGHALISGNMANGKRGISKWHAAMTAAYGNPAKELFAFAGKYVSSYAVTNKGQGPSMAECLSECFSLATSPDYQPGYLPPPVEDFIFGEMLGMKK